MCNCNKPKTELSMTPEELANLSEHTATRLERAELSLKKIEDWIPLLLTDICPFCKTHKWTRCKNWCIVTGQRL